MPGEREREGRRERERERETGEEAGREQERDTLGYEPFALHAPSTTGLYRGM